MIIDHFHIKVSEVSQLAPFVTIIVLTFNSINEIDECLSSMLRQTYPNFSILLIDSCSSDGTVEHVRTHFPKISIVELKTNEGYRRGNAFGMKVAEGDLVVVCNDDVMVESEWLRAMVDVMSDGIVGIVTPMILLADNPDVVNAAGNTLHFTGMYGPRGKNENRRLHEKQRTVAAASGCCFMVSRELLTKLNGFSTDFDIYNTGWHASFEDVDFGWRLQLLGYRIEYTPSAIMYHKYQQPDMLPTRFASYEWGRYITILRCYESVTIVLLIPLLIVIELCAWIYATSKGCDYVKAKWGVMNWIFRNIKEIMRMRQRVQAMRKVSDLEIVRRMDQELNLSGSLGSNVINRTLALIFTKVSKLYYRALVKALSILNNEYYIIR
jgi:GT2 family glycosyltransferase